MKQHNQLCTAHYKLGEVCGCPETGCGNCDRLVSELKGKEARLKYECDEVDRLKADNENLIWNLAGCSTFALGYGVNESFDEKSARPALTDVLALRKKYDHLRSLAQGMAEALESLCFSIAGTVGTKTNAELPGWYRNRLADGNKALALWDAYEKEQGK